MQDEREREAIAQEAIRGVILRRRDDYARVLRELGGQLFARKGNVDKYFDDFDTEKARKALEARELAVDRMNHELAYDFCGRKESSPPDPEEDARTLRLIRITERIREHMFYAGEREAVAPRAANTRQGIERLRRIFRNRKPPIR